MDPQKSHPKRSWTFGPAGELLADSAELDAFSFNAALDAPRRRELRAGEWVAQPTGHRGGGGGKVGGGVWWTIGTTGPRPVRVRKEKGLAAFWRKWVKDAWV